MAICSMVGHGRPRQSQVQQGTARYSQERPGTPRYCQVQPGTMLKRPIMCNIFEKQALRRYQTWGLQLVVQGDYLETTWRLLEDYLETSCRLLGDHLEIAWRLLGDFLETSWRLGDYMETTWRPCGDYLVITWGPLVLVLVVPPLQSPQVPLLAPTLKIRCAICPFSSQQRCLKP